MSEHEPEQAVESLSEAAPEAPAQLRLTVGQLLFLWLYSGFQFFGGAVVLYLLFRWPFGDGYFFHYLAFYWFVAVPLMLALLVRKARRTLGSSA